MKKNKEHKQSSISRRDFLSNTAKAALGTTIAMGFPSIVPASVLGKNAPSNRINVGAIGSGRIGRIHDMPGVWQYDYAQLMAVCDLDSLRAEDGKKLIDGVYTKQKGSPWD